MSIKIKVQQLLPFTLPEYGKQSYISTLIWSILELEEKLSRPQEQSFYFRLGIQSNIDSLERLKRSYEKYRSEFNTLTVDQCLAKISERRKIMHKERNRYPLFSRAFLMAALRSRIDRLEGFTQLKPITDRLPAWLVLKQDGELLTKLV